ncbi:MAG: HEAT repeat domain-containing protein [Planctomycetales bacterium]|nr:HEAT repeat domain-containing protein [Planctomycetales bacterium]
MLDVLKRPEYRYRYWAKRELRSRDSTEVRHALDEWTRKLDSSDSRFRHHQIEAIWAYRWIGETKTDLLRELLACENRHARAAATQQLRYWHQEMPDAARLLRSAANDANAMVRMEAIIAASYIGSRDAFDAAIDVLNHPHGKHLTYAITSSLGSAALRQYWQDEPDGRIASILKSASQIDTLREPTPSGRDAQFDSQKDIARVDISCMPERMLYTKTVFTVRPGQPTKLVFTNPDATDHNLLILKPGAVEAVGMAANEMARDPKNANSDFIPTSQTDLILHASPMIGPTRKSRIHVLRFNAPATPGIYPYLCTFPGHWVVMRGDMIVATSDEHAERLLAERTPEAQYEWQVADFVDVVVPKDETSVMRGMQAFMKARCNQCHSVAGHGENIGADISQIGKKYQGSALLQHIIEPSREIAEQYRNYQITTVDGKVLSGMIVKQSPAEIELMPNLLTPTTTITIKRSDIESQVASRTSSMPTGLLNVLDQEEVTALLAYLQHGYEVPEHLKHAH